MNNRYMMRGVSAAKEDVHNAIKNLSPIHISEPTRPY